MLWFHRGHLTLESWKMPIDIYKDYDTKFWKTKSARFNASRRLRAKQAWSIFTLSILSFYNLIMSFPSLLGVSQQAQTDTLSPVAILTSIFVLIISLLEVSKAYEVRAERLDKSAMEINQIHSRLRMAHSVGDDLGPIIEAYHELIKTCPENHEPQDYKLVEAGEVKGLKVICSKFMVARYWMQNRALYVVLLVAPPAVFLVLRYS